MEAGNGLGGEEGVVQGAAVWRCMVAMWGRRFFVFWVFFEQLCKRCLIEGRQLKVRAAGVNVALLMQKVWLGRARGSELLCHSLALGCEWGMTPTSGLACPAGGCCWLRLGCPSQLLSPAASPGIPWPLTALVRLCRAPCRPLVSPCCKKLLQE